MSLPCKTVVNISVTPFRQNPTGRRRFAPGRGKYLLRRNREPIGRRHLREVGSGPFGQGRKVGCHPRTVNAGHAFANPGGTRPSGWQRAGDLGFSLSAAAKRRGTRGARSADLAIHHRRATPRSARGGAVGLVVGLNYSMQAGKWANDISATPKWRLKDSGQKNIARESPPDSASDNSPPSGVVARLTHFFSHGPFFCPLSFCLFRPSLRAPRFPWRVARFSSFHSGTCRRSTGPPWRIRPSFPACCPTPATGRRVRRTISRSKSACIFLRKPQNVCLANRPGPIGNSPCAIRRRGSGELLELRDGVRTAFTFQQRLAEQILQWHDVGTVGLGKRFAQALLGLLTEAEIEVARAMRPSPSGPSGLSSRPCQSESSSSLASRRPPLAALARRYSA